MGNGLAESARVGIAPGFPETRSVRAPRPGRLGGAFATGSRCGAGLGGTRCRHCLQLPGHLRTHAGDAAVQLHARPPEPVRRKAPLGEMVAHRVVVGLLAAVLQQHRVTYRAVREVAGEGVEKQAGRVVRPAAFGVHERDEARHVAPRRRVRVEVLGDESGHLSRAEAGRHHERDLVRCEPAAGGHRVEGERQGRRRAHRDRASVRSGPAADLLQPFLSRPRPVAPNRDLGVPGELALAALPRSDVERELERLRPERAHVHAVVVAPRVHVHLVREQLEAPGGGHELERRHEGEVGDRAVAGDEQDEVRAGRDLPGDALQVVPGAVHEVVAGRAHGLRVVDDVVEPDLGVLLARGAERLERDVVEPAEVVSPGRVALRGGAVVRRVTLEALDLLQELPGGGGIADVVEHVGLGTDELVGLGEVGRSAVADDLLRHPAR